MIALPPLSLHPSPSDPSHITLTICHGGRGVWLDTSIPKNNLLALLSDWERDPEGTFLSLFGIDWPRGLGHHGSPQKRQASVDFNPEDII
jgi:hypothetical protein